MKPTSLKELINHSQGLFVKQDIERENKNLINPQDIINEYHYNFYSRKNYKTSCLYNIYTFFCLSTVILSICMYCYFSISKTTTLYLNILHFLLYLFSLIGFAIGVIRNQNIVTRQIIYKFRRYLSKGERKRYLKNIAKMPFHINNQQVINIISTNWLDEKIHRYNYLYIAEKISKTSKFLKIHNVNKSIPFLDIIYTSDSKVRITSYLIALFSLIGVILIKNSDTSIFFELFTMEVLGLYIRLAILAFAFMFLIFVYQHLAIDIFNSIQDVFDDLFKRDKIPNKNRVNRFIRVLIINHKENLG